MMIVFWFDVDENGYVHCKEQMRPLESDVLIRL